MIKILFVEDDVNLREIYAARLSAEDYIVFVASDGEEALAKSIQEKPDLIVLDVMMPKISGFDVLDIIRSTPEVKDTKVIILTALSQETDRVRAEKLGVNKYLVKSQITLEDVVDAIRKSLGQKPEDTGTETDTQGEIESDNTAPIGSSNSKQIRSEDSTIHDVSGAPVQAKNNTTDEQTSPEEIEDNVQNMLQKSGPDLEVPTSVDSDGRSDVLKAGGIESDSKQNESGKAK